MSLFFVTELQVEDSGTYVCVAQNEHGSIEAHAQLRITNLSKILTQAFSGLPKCHFMII